MRITPAPAQLVSPANSPPPVDVETSVADRLRQVAAWRGDHPALRQGDQTYSFQQLDALTEQIASGLAPAIPEPGARVPLLFPSGEAAVLLALFGVLKAGGAYTGLSPTFPLERNRALWDDSDPCALLTDRQHAALALDIAQEQRPVLVLEELLEDTRPPRPAPTILPDQLATILYTSGSTGRPKGIVRRHQDFLRRLNRPSEFGITPESRLVMSRFIGYAASGGLFVGLLNGATIYTLNLQQLSIPELIHFLQVNAITSFSLPISVFRELAAQTTARLDLPHLTRLGLAGEALLKTDVEAFQRVFPKHCVLSHGFAASEAGGGARLTITHDTVISTPRVPVGRPGKNVEVLLWDEHGQPVPDGEAGEIVIRSSHVASGYWRNPELSRQVFLPDPDGGDRRLYLTGDMGRWLPDGNLMHLGRKDQMVKIRGYRVEPAEAEIALRQLAPNVQFTVVAREREPGELELVAFAVPGPGAAFTPLEWRRGLTSVLPGYLIPARFVRLEQWPYTVSNKVDLRALQRLDLPPAEPADTYVPPADDQERQLAEIWESVLKVKPIGRQDDFFELGGHSLAAVALLARVAKATGHSLPMTALFEAPTVAHLAALLRGDSRTRKLPPAIVTFNPLGDRLPLFLLPELESSAMNLIKLVRHLGVERPVYGLQPRGFEDGQQPFATIPEQAAYYVEAIRAVRPHGPYHLAGICYGGVVAYEVARQLQAQGERVAALCLIDVPGVKLADAGWQETVQRAWAGARRRLRLWRSFTRERLQPHLRLSPTPSKTSRRFYDDQGRLQPGRRLRYAQNLAGLRYRALPFEGRASLLRSGEFDRHGPPKAWQTLVRGGIELQLIPDITHHDLLSKAEHLRAMAHWLAACLEHADPRMVRAA